MANLLYDKPFDEQTIVEKLLNRAHIRRNAEGRKSVEEGKEDRLADLLEEAAEHIMCLENDIAYWKSKFEGTWPS